MRQKTMTDSQQAALERLKHALATKNAAEIEPNLSRNMLTNDFTLILIQLLDSDWHRSHKAIVLSLQHLRDPSAIDALFRTAGRQFPYLGPKESEVYWRICIWALATFGEHGRQKLEILTEFPISVVADHAKERLKHWRTPKKDLSKSPHYRQIRAVFDEDTVRVYQAYSHRIAEPAVQTGNFVSPPFSMKRMTWIKPSFLWMMYRSGWGLKPGQERVLGIDITREGFEWALEHACLTRFEAQTDHTPDEWKAKNAHTPVRIQWDPERDIKLHRVPYRSIQIGLAGEAVQRYVGQWIKGMSDLTPFVNRVREMLKVGETEDARRESVTSGKAGGH
jgi:hypothetical protein